MDFFSCSLGGGILVDNWVGWLFLLVGSLVGWLVWFGLYVYNEHYMRDGRMSEWMGMGSRASCLDERGREEGSIGVVCIERRTRLGERGQYKWEEWNGIERDYNLMGERGYGMWNGMR